MHAAKPTLRWERRLLACCRLLVERQGHEVHEGPYPRRQLVPLRIYRVDIGVRSEVLGQHLHQAPVLQVTINVPLGTHEHAVAVERPVDGDLAVVGGQVATGLDGLGGCASTAAAGEAPYAVGLLALPNADAVVPGQIVRYLGDAVLGQVGGRRTQYPTIRRDVPRDYARIRWCPEPDADIERIIRQRWRVDRQLQLHLDLRVLADET